MKFTDEQLNKIEKKIVIIPHGHDPESFYQDDMVGKSEVFTFIANKGWSQGENDRGGMQYILKAFNEEFTDKDNVQLKCKINAVYNPPEWNIQTEMDKLKLDRKGKAPIFTTHDNLNDKGLRDFYNQGDVFVSMSMAEAFNLPVLEAMACGLPAIISGYGGQTDFSDNSNGWIVNKGEYGYFSKEPIYEETKWFKPSISAIRTTLREVYTNRQSVKKKRVKALKMAQTMTWNSSARKLKQIINHKD